MQSRGDLQLDFLEQCAIGDEQKVRNMLNAHLVDVNYQHPINGWTALHWGARRGYERICHLLLSSGFSREIKDKSGRTPWDVCSKDNLTLREILRPELETFEEEFYEIMPSAGNRRRSSEAGAEKEKFVPNYIRNPPFPYVTKASSFDYGTKTPPSPTTPNGYFSYGRRDSVNRTRFLLVRTCCTNGKQAFKRVTLPGGSSLEQLKKTLEKSMRRGRVEAIMTLPDRVLVEEDSQIAQFSDCQRVEVIYDDNEDAAASEQPVNTRPTPKRSMEKETEEVKPQEHSSPAPEAVATAGGGGGGGDDNFPITLVEQFPRDQPDSSNAAQDDSLSLEGSIPLEPVPSMDVTPVETEENNEVQSEVESAHKISFRKSIDSDPGDFVKIEKADNGSSDVAAVEIKQPSPPIIVSSSSTDEEKKEPEILKPAEEVQEKREEKEEKKPEPPKPQETKERKAGEKAKDKSPTHSLLTWIHENPIMARCCAATAAVVGVAGIGCFVFARALKKGFVTTRVPAKQCDSTHLREPIVVVF
ncbi:hypothetical protein RB195_016386 [Necator americanus]|uniref:Ankyrin repeat protein n=1 Tax=Necator americanus TaxID=51031 RepID=A0ABR1EAU3_NECAM